LLCCVLPGLPLQVHEAGHRRRAPPYSVRPGRQHLAPLF
jgi:hypothetical protein